MEFIVDVQPMAACMRVLFRWQTPRQDPYIVAASVLYLDEHTVELMGVTEPKTPDSMPDGVDASHLSFISMRSAVCRAFYLRGVDTIRWHRMRPGKEPKIVVMDTKKYAMKKSTE